MEFYLMTSQFTLPEQLKMIDASAGPVTTNGGVTLDAIALKNAHKVCVVVKLTQAVGHATAIALRQATDVAIGTNKAGPASRIWANEDTVASDALVRQADAASYTVANTVKKKMIVFEVDPATLDINGGYNTLYATVADSSQATNFVDALYLVQGRYAGATPPGGPSMIVD